MARDDGMSRRRAVAKPSAAAPERQVAFDLGISAESRAAAYLIAKGFRILARRWRTPVGEIDIVARRRHLLVFVEVKARADLDQAAESVTPRQQHRIAAAAEVWLADQPTPMDSRYSLRRHPGRAGKMPPRISRRRSRRVSN